MAESLHGTTHLVGQIAALSLKLVKFHCFHLISEDDLLLERVSGQERAWPWASSLLLCFWISPGLVPIFPLNGNQRR